MLTTKTIIKKTEKYKVGIGGIRAMLGGDKQKAIEFENGNQVEVTPDEFKRIKKFDWCVLIEEEENGN